MAGPRPWGGRDDGAGLRSNAEIEGFAALVPKELAARSGEVFYAGRAAFGATCPIYLLGFKPGGHEEDHPEETIGEHTRWVLKEWPPEWTALLDEV